VNDYLDEEEQIMDEQDCSDKSICAEIFHFPISRLNPNRCVTIEDTADLNAVITLMKTQKSSSVVITKNKKVTGIFTEKDLLLKVIGIVDDFNSAMIGDFMTPEPTCLFMEDMIAYALHNMHFGDYRHVPILNSNHEPIAVVSIRDVNNFLMEYFPEEIDNLMDEPFRGVRIREGA